MPLNSSSCGGVMLHLQIEPRKDVIEQFFDTREDLSSTYDSCPISPVTCLTSPISPATCLASPSGDDSQNLISPGTYKLWTSDPISVLDRRAEFRRWMCLTPTPTSRSRPAFIGQEDGTKRDDGSRIGTETSGLSSHTLQSSSIMEGGSLSSNSRWSSENSHSSDESLPEESFLSKIANWDDGNASLHSKLEKSLSSRKFSDVISGQMLLADGIPRPIMPSGILGQFMRREDNGSARSSVTSSTNSEDSVGTRRRKWLRRLGMMACIVDRQEDYEPSLRSLVVDKYDQKKPDRIKVHLFWKRSREFSAVYKEQDFAAHNGAIWTMKFSLDGKFLATGGEDGVVRVWSVTEREHVGEGLLEDGLSRICLPEDQNQVCAASEKKKSQKNGKADPAVILIPPKVFQLSEEPLHQFQGHNGDIVDLSWSKDKYLISSSLDKTVRLWQVGCEGCLRVFRHNDYVTCVQFNPAEENLFISGSIDGIVRIWDISTCHVVDWSDMTEIVTALCFQPDGKGVVVGSITGNCRFFTITDNHLQVDTDVSLHGKKGSTRKRITGFQFSQSNPMKLLVTSADSQIRVMEKFSVVHKYKGFRNVGGLISASFTKDGRHIVSASEDSNVFIWSHTNRSAPVTRAKITRSYERFFSSEASVAVPWHGFVSLPLQSEEFSFQTEGYINKSTNMQSGSSVDNPHRDQSSNCSTTNTGSVLDSINKNCSSTWPEENLPTNPVVVDKKQPKSEHKFPKNACQNMDLSPHSWGQVIVTSGCDGRIRVFCNYGLPVHG